MMWRKRRALLPALLCAGALWQLGGAGYIHAKALLAQALLQHAWAETVRNGRPVAPWPWADTWPVARLRVPRHAEDLIVLAGVSGHALAFAPGHVDDSAAPGNDGRIVFAGHRDTHFAFLRDLRSGDALLVQDANGAQREYAVSRTAIVDSETARLFLDGPEELILVTCYPFDALAAGGPLRYVVFAQPGRQRTAGRHDSSQFTRQASVIRTRGGPLSPV